VPDVTVVGSANLDFVVSVDRLPAPGETVLGGDLVIAHGGKGANQALAASRAGASVAFIAKLGRDGHGDEIRRHLLASGLSLDAVLEDPAAPTGVAFIVVEAGGRNQIVVAPGSNLRLSRGDLVIVLVNQSDFVVGTDRPAHGLHPHLLGIIQPDEHQHPLGHAEVFLDGDARNELFGAAAHLGLKPLSPALNHLQGRQIEFLDQRVVDPADQERGNHVDVRDAVAFYQRENILAARRVGQHDFAAVQQKALQAGTGQRQVVRQGQRVQQDLIGPHGGHGRRHL